MSLNAPGEGTSQVEVTHVSSHGIWVLAGSQELFMSYDDFPWFKDVSLRKILNVEEPAPGHFYWPELDVDLTTQIILNPEQFPLKAK
jgi:Protein of unknown function (DUF2442)